MRASGADAAQFDGGAIRQMIADHKVGFIVRAIHPIDFAAAVEIRDDRDIGRGSGHAGAASIVRVIRIGAGHEFLEVGLTVAVVVPRDITGVVRIEVPGEFPIIGHAVEIGIQRQKRIGAPAQLVVVANLVAVEIRAKGIGRGNVRVSESQEEFLTGRSEGPFDGLVGAGLDERQIAPVNQVFGMLNEIGPPRTPPLGKPMHTLNSIVSHERTFVRIGRLLRHGQANDRHQDQADFESMREHKSASDGIDAAFHRPEADDGFLRDRRSDWRCTLTGRLLGFTLPKAARSATLFASD